MRQPGRGDYPARPLGNIAVEQVGDDIELAFDKGQLRNIEMLTMSDARKLHSLLSQVVEPGGKFIDIVFDFVFYGAVPLAFALRDPAIHAVPAAVLLFSFYVNGASFLAFAAVAAKRSLESRIHGIKAIYYSVGLAEGTETILVFAAMILRPDWFPILAYAFAGLTMMSAISRVALAWAVFRDEPDETGEAGEGGSAP